MLTLIFKQLVDEGEEDTLLFRFRETTEEKQASAGFIAHLKMCQKSVCPPRLSLHSSDPIINDGWIFSR